MSELPHRGKISQTSDGGFTHKTITAEYGNGARQFAADGLKARREMMTINYYAFTRQEMLDVTAILDDIGGWGTLQYESPISNELKNWTVPEGRYSFQALSGDHYSLTFQLEQDFRGII